MEEIKSRALYKSQSLQFPLNVGPDFTIRKLGWNDFTGKPNINLPWSAHIYWSIEYIFRKRKHKRKPAIIATVNVLPTSWVKRENASDALLQHQNGHYLIGCLCALDFLKRVETGRMPLSYNFIQYTNIVFNSTLRQYIRLEKRYDQETQHRLNYEKQIQWNQFFYNKILEHLSQERKKNQKEFVVKAKHNPLKKK